MTDARREAIAKALYEALNNSPTCYDWDDSGLDDEHPGSRLRYYRQADAVIALDPQSTRAAVLEEAAREMEQYEGLLRPDHLAARIRALIPSPPSSGEGERA